MNCHQSVIQKINNLIDMLIYYDAQTYISLWIKFSNKFFFFYMSEPSGVRLHCNTVCTVNVLYLMCTKFSGN